MTDKAKQADTRPLSERLRAAGNGEPYQLHWLCEAAETLDKMGLTLMMIAEAAPDNWSRKIAAERLGREFKPVLSKGTKIQSVTPNSK